MNKNNVTTMDEKARQSIIQDIDKNLFVEAGAGSGKTTMLVNRMVSMIENGKPIEKICAITFTKNAALEFYKRFQEKLIERSNLINDDKKRYDYLDKQNETTIKRCKEALENIDLCFMGTIDSFCNMVLSEHPLEAHIPSDASLISENDAKELYKQFYIDIRRNKYNKELRELSDRFDMFFNNSEEIFSILIQEIMDRRNVTFHFQDDLCIDFFKCFNKQRNELKKVLNTFALDTSKLTVNAKKNDTSDLVDIFLDANRTIQKGWNYNFKGIEFILDKVKDIGYEGTSEELGLKDISVIRDVDGKVFLNIGDNENKDALINKLKNYKYQNTLKFLLSCVPYLEELMRKNGKFTFFDYLLYLRNMLIEDSKKEGKLIEYIYNRHSYFLIDEFQDTNPLQAEIFYYLAAKDPKQKSWKDCKPKDGSLFIVGDPKQSIYRFRSADVTSYLNVKKLFEDNKDNCAVKYLVNNFRSRSVLKQYFNEVFAEVMNEDTLDQSKYQLIENECSKEDEEFDGIYSYISYTGKALYEDPFKDDKYQIVKIIESIKNSDKKIIKVKKINEDNKITEVKELRKINYSDFMVITYGKGNIKDIINAFNLYGIPYKVEGRILFDETEALKVIATIYKTVTTRNDTISLVETLKSKRFGFNDNDLNEYKKDNKEIKLDLNNEYQEDGIQGALNKLKETAKIISKQTPSSLYEYIIDEYELFKYVPDDNLEIVYFVLELIREKEQNGEIITYEDANNYIEDLLNDKVELERCLSLKQDVDAVHIANLHKVKGLEAPIVILTKSGKFTPKPKVRIEYNDDLKTKQTKTDGYIVSFKNDKIQHTAIIETTNLEEYKDKEKESLKKENDRLIYVAATRARNVLIINDTYCLYNKSTTPKSNGKQNKWHYLLPEERINIFDVENINEFDLENNEKKVEETIDAKELYDDVSLTNLKAQETYQFKKPSDIKVSSKMIDDQNEDEIYNNSVDATLTGTIVHRLMEMMILSKDKIIKKDLINNILNEYLNIEELDKRSDYEKILNDVYDVMHHGGYLQTNKAPKDILPILIDDNVKAYPEVPFTFKDDKNRIWNGIIDLLYFKDDKAHIIDWKTNKSGIDLDEHYKSQLEDYKYAVENALGIKIEDALIYHLQIK